MPVINTSEARNSDRVYLAIKARAVACAFDPGKPIRVSPLASQLGVSTTPIRAALNMLVADGLVRRRPQKGFIAVSMSEERFNGLYDLNLLLLEAALTAKQAGTKLLAAAAPVVAGLGRQLDDDKGCNPEAIGRYTGELFSCVAALSGNARVVETVERINDSLNYIRVLECRRSNDVCVELMTICELLLAEPLNAATTAIAIADYHAGRRARLPQLLATARR